MNRFTLHSELLSYQLRYAEEACQVGRFLDLLNHPDCFRRSLLSGHFTASCWVFNSTHDSVLLLHHKKLDKWLQPGGHADGDENLLRVAKKELLEETGLAQVKLLKEGIFDIDIHTIPSRKDVPEHEHFDVRFFFVSEEDNELVKNHESNELSWVAMEEVDKYANHESSILRMLHKMNL